MRRPARVLIAAVAPVLIAAVVWAAEKSDRSRSSSDAAASAPASDDVQRLLLLAPGRPLRIDLPIFVDGKPLMQAWRERFGRVFADEDRDRSGQLELAPAIRVCEAMGGDFGTRHPRAEIRGALLELAGKGKSESDARIDRAALIGYIEKIFPPFSIAAAAAGTAGEDALFGLLDADHDGRLSRAELQQAATRLLGRDFDDDQLISERELIIDPTQEIDRGNEKSTGLDAARESAILLSPGVDPAVVASAVLKHYDRNGDGRLSVSGAEAELIVSPDLVAEIDLNHDGFFDAQELQALARRTADVVLPIEFGAAVVGRPLTHKIARPSDELRVRKSLVFGGYRMYLGDVRIDLDRNPGDPLQNGGGLRFSAFDTDKNGYLDKMEVRASPVLAAAFPAMDADGDGKITPGEFQTYVDTQGKAAATRIRLEVSDRGHDLFALLDANGDGLLTPRELADAVELLDTQDHNGDGVLSGSEIPQHWSLKVSREALPIPDVRIARPNVRSRQLTASEAGPLWFRKMDRNHDGDLTPKEFLGTAADFAEADTNHDGLIDAEEAEAFSKRRGIK